VAGFLQYNHRENEGSIGGVRGAEGGRLSTVQLQRDEWSRVLCKEVTIAGPQSQPSVQTIHVEHESGNFVHSQKLYS